MEVKAVKAVTEVTLALTGDEASVLMSMAVNAFAWDGTRTGQLANSIYHGLENAGVDTAGIAYVEENGEMVEAE